MTTIDLNLKQLKYLRGVLSIARMYKPYEDRQDANLCPKGTLWNDFQEDLFIQVTAAIMRQYPDCPPWSPYGEYPDIIDKATQLNNEYYSKRNDS